MVGEFGAVEHTGVYEQVTRPQRLVFTWRTPYLGEHTTRVRVDLTAILGGTRMVIEHIGLPAGDAEAHIRGWASIAAQLGSLVQRS